MSDIINVTSKSVFPLQIIKKSINCHFIMTSTYVKCQIPHYSLFGDRIYRIVLSNQTWLTY